MVGAFFMAHNERSVSRLSEFSPILKGGFAFTWEAPRRRQSQLPEENGDECEKGRLRGSKMNHKNIKAGSGILAHQEFGGGGD